MKIFYHPIYLKHLQTSGHPESPERLTATIKKLNECNLTDDIIQPSIISEGEVAKVHARTYMEAIKNFGEGYYDMDTYVRPTTYEIALYAVGGAVEAAEYAYKNNQPSFALVRPPGHHAGVDYAGGFCYLNNVAIASQLISEKYGKVAIVDIDVHHGNGTADIFKDRKDVLYISTHQWGIYPGTGRIDDVGIGEGKGYTVNIPLNARCGDATFKYAYELVIEPILRQFKPVMVLVSIGLDAHYLDPIGNLTLSTNGYIELAEKLIKLTEGQCSFILEGGYHTGALAEAVCAIVGLPNRLPVQYTEIYDTNCFGKKTIEKVVDIQSVFWKL